MSSTIGEVQELKTEYVFEWKIRDFFSVFEVGTEYTSPTFIFDGEPWNLKIKQSLYEDSIILRFCRELSGPSKALLWSVALKTDHRKKDYEKQFSDSFHGICDNQSYAIGFLNVSEVQEKKSILVPSGVLTVVCTIYCCNIAPDEWQQIQICSCNPNIKTRIKNYKCEECPYCEDLFLEPHISIHEEMCQKILCVTCKEKWEDHECPKQKKEKQDERSVSAKDSDHVAIEEGADRPERSIAL